jgi:hypothetical protein
LDLGEVFGSTALRTETSPFQAREEQAFPPEPSAAEYFGGVVLKALGFLSVRPRGSEISTPFYAFNT